MLGGSFVVGRLHWPSSLCWICFESGAGEEAWSLSISFSFISLHFEAACMIIPLTPSVWMFARWLCWSLLTPWWSRLLFLFWSLLALCVEVLYLLRCRIGAGTWPLGYVLCVSQDLLHGIVAFVQENSCERESVSPPHWHLRWSSG